MNADELKTKEEEEEEANEEQKKRRQVGIPAVDPDALPPSTVQKNLTLGSKTCHTTVS